LSEAGVCVDLLDASLPGSESSWAGGGIVSPLYPWRYSPAITALASWAQDFYPGFSQRLLHDTGLDPEFDRWGLIMLDAADAPQALQWAHENGKRMSVHDGTRLGNLVPSATTDLGQFLAMPDVGSIRNPRLVRAMLALLAKCPRVTIHPNTPVTGLLLDSGSVTGVRTQARDYAADAVVLCSGAWTSALLADIDACPPIKPVRGQMVAFQAVTGLLETILLRDGTYLIPRRGGVVLAGSTLEFVGFDKTTTQSARDWLVSRAIGMCPRLAEAELIAHWAGLRPGSPEGIPWIGPWPGTKGLFLNAGHYRNGLVLAPAASRLLADLLLERPLSVSADSCLPASRLHAARVSPDLEWTTQSS
jgi:glycine oxidase